LVRWKQNNPHGTFPHLLCGLFNRGTPTFRVDNNLYLDGLEAQLQPIKRL
jgi:hypothetical protein